MTLGADVHDGRSNVYRWRVAQLDWVAWDGSLTTGALTIGVVDQGAPGASAWPVNQSLTTMLSGSGDTASAGNTSLLTPAAGKKIRLLYVSYNNPGGAVEVAFRFGAGGSLFLRNNLTATGSIVAKDFRFGFLDGGVDVPLMLNLSAGVSTIWNAFYVEV